jgi:ELWxxDGT repeat protein
MNKQIPLVSITLSLMLFISTALFAQETLVKDINTTPAGMRPKNDYSELFCKCGDYLFFNVPGKELWRTDWTPEGTISLGDIYKGYTQGVAGFWTMACTEDKTLFFVANDGISGWELWRSDGSPAGTKMIKDATSGNNVNWGIFIELGLIGNTYYFIIDHDDDKQLELWKSDGTESTTVMVPDFPAFSSVRWVMSSDTHHFFRAQNPVTEKYELWATEGTGANTIKLMEDYYQGPWENLGTKVMFSLSDRSDNTNSIWESDGTLSGTFKVKDFGTQYLQRFERFNDKLIFGVYSDTWISDGTEVGTTFLSSGSADGSITVENNFYAFGYDFSTGFHRILKTDGAAIEISNLNDSEPFTMSMHHTIPIKQMAPRMRLP